VIKPGTLVSRLVALGLLALLVIGLATTVVTPLAERWAELREARAHGIELAGRFRAIAETRDRKVAELAEAEAAIAGSGLYLEAASEALAGAEIREILKAAVAEHGGEVRSVRVLQGTEEAGQARTVTLKVAMRGMWAELFPVLHALESGTPQLTITSFTIDAARGRRSRRSVETEQAMEMDFELQGYLAADVSG